MKEPPSSLPRFCGVLPNFRSPSLRHWQARRRTAAGACIQPRRHLELRSKITNMAMSEEQLHYLESLWAVRLRELMKERDSRLSFVRRGLMDHSDIYARIGFENYLEPELDHLRAIGVARSECWLMAFGLDAKPLTPEAIEKALFDAATHTDSATDALFKQKKNEIQSMRPIPPGFTTQPIPDPLELSSRLAKVQGEAKDQLRQELTIQMYASRSREHLASKAQASASSPSVNQTINIHGPNARVNLDSIDNSTNAVRQDAPFSEVRKAVEEGVANGIERAAILKSLADLELATEKESGAARYAAFIAAAANHMQLILPFLPLLSHWAGNL